MDSKGNYTDTRLNSKQPRLRQLPEYNIGTQTNQRCFTTNNDNWVNKHFDFTESFRKSLLFVRKQKQKNIFRRCNSLRSYKETSFGER